MTDAILDTHPGIQVFPDRWSVGTWASIVSMSAATFALVSAEFLPAGLLTPMAADLGISEGTAGQVVTATAAVGAVAALFANVVIGRLNRKLVLVGLSALAVISNLLAAFATEFWVLLLGRAGLGIALSGFWSLSAAVVARLVGVQALGRGMAIIFVGVSLATIAAPALGALISDWIGWRAAMAATAAAAALALLLQLISLPSLPAEKGNSLVELFRLTGRRGVQLGMLAILLLITGHMAAFVYVRPFLEQVTVMSTSSVALALLTFGLASVLGNIAGGKMADANVRAALISVGLVLGGAILALTFWGGATVPALCLVGAWGFAFGATPIVLQTNASRAALDALEACGSLIVVCFQLAIGLGAAIGGQIVDVSGVSYSLTFGAVLAFLAAGVGLVSRRR
jgi:DHA1 family purine ribonucleoside efflux pump-like MFS transporter